MNISRRHFSQNGSLEIQYKVLVLQNDDLQDIKSNTSQIEHEKCVRIYIINM